MIEDRRRMIETIKEFSCFKAIMDKNSQMIAISPESLRTLEIHQKYHYELQTQKFKILDCKMIFNLFEDLQRYRNMIKIQEDQFIFVKRSIKPTKN